MVQLLLGQTNFSTRIMALRIQFFVIFLFSFVQLFGQEKEIVTIKGYAPSYVGGTIQINEIEDFVSMKESSIASTTVKEDSTFTLSFYAKQTQKVVVRANKNHGLMYIQPKATYDIFVPDKDPYEPKRPNGNLIEVTFFDLDSLDINYKILSYLRWQDDFIGKNYHLRGPQPAEFAKRLDLFKTNVEKAYSADSLDVYFKTFVRFSIASLDNIQTAADRNRYEKHDFYLKNFPVSYQNDAYMGYVNTFYEKMLPRLAMETNNRVYLGILKSSPTLVMKALGAEYTLINMRIREMVMIKALTEVFYTKQYPQTNILTILDSLSNNSLFEANQVIARNMKARLTELVPGGKAPDFALTNDKGETKTLLNYSKKYIYIHFYDPTGLKSTIELEPLIQLHSKYQYDVTFITVYPNKPLDETAKQHLAKLPWEKFSADEGASIFNNYKVETYPYYVLIDETGYVVASPALTPMPNGQYETIDKTFFFIREAREALRQNNRR